LRGDFELSKTDPIPHDALTSSRRRDPEVFLNTVRELLENTAKSKGYNAEGLQGRNALYEFIYHQLGLNTHTHALGEIVYKAVRYNSKKNEEDLVKIAAWALLVWLHHEK